MVGEYTTFMGSPALIVEIFQAQHFASTTSSITVEAVLMLNTGATPGNIYLEYPDLTFGDPTLDNGESATVGVKAAGTPVSQQVTLVDYNSNTTIVQTGNAVLLTPGFAGPGIAPSILGPAIAPSVGDGGSTTPSLPGSGNGPVIIAPWTTTDGTIDARTGAHLNVRRKSN